ITAADVRKYVQKEYLEYSRRELEFDVDLNRVDNKALKP
ncbi:unnamed protein product, partial [Didymodactylos carnosus]